MSSLLGPNILLSTLFSNTLNTHSSLTAKHQVSDAYKSEKISFILYVNHYAVDRREDGKSMTVLICSSFHFKYNFTLLLLSISFSALLHTQFKYSQKKKKKLFIRN